MILVIPAIEIRQSLCAEKIHALDVDYIDPASRARLLRKENAKALHLVIDDEDAWCDHALGIVKALREAVDIPTEVSLSHLPENDDDLQKLISYGVYRIILPQETPHEKINSLIAKFNAQRIVPSFNLNEKVLEFLPSLKEMKVQRIALISPDDEHFSLDWNALGEIVSAARELKLRLTCLFGVTGYRDLHRLQVEYSPVVDSVVLGSALFHNVFPCQGIWREAERLSIERYGEESNLWRNPLEGVPHI